MRLVSPDWNARLQTRNALPSWTAVARNPVRFRIWCSRGFVHILEARKEYVPDCESLSLQAKKLNFAVVLCSGHPSNLVGSASES